MRSIVVVDHPKTSPFQLPGVRLFGAREYLADRSLGDERHLKVFNLCKSYRYQSLGYYVSLLAMARSHVPLPSIATIQDMRSASLSRLVADELDGLIQRCLRRLRTDQFTLSVYFGRNVARGYDELAAKIFALFQAPLIRARFRRDESHWRLEGIRPIPWSEVPDEHRAFATESAANFFEKDRLPARRRNAWKYDLAILVNEAEVNAPSNAGALRRFAAAGRRQRVRTEFISRGDYGRLGEFDGLLIRETTQVHHYTYRFARRAAAEGLVVVDDPDSIIKCTNKVYLAELLERQRIPTPRTTIVSRDNRDEVVTAARYPCIVKQPDSSFSQGVHKVENGEELDSLLDRLLSESDLLIVQEFVPTSFDWRIGVLDRRVLYACRYHMVRKHWQIAQAGGARTTYGKVDAVSVDDVPPLVVRCAVRAANAIGAGLYGVDVKQFGRRAIVIEVNDNPNIDAGMEDAVLGPELYDRIIRYFVTRIDRRRGTGETHGRAASSV